MKNSVFISIFFFVTITLTAQEMTEGIWLTGEENTMIETYQKDGAWYGKIVSSDNPKAIMGRDILQHFINENDKWKGKLYAAKRDKLLDAEIIPAADKLNIIVSAGFFTKELEWIREGSN